MKKKRLLVVVLALVALIPAYAVLNEKDLSQTLSVLRYELRSAWKASSERAQRTMSRGARQRAQLVEMMQRSNELSLMLYSQKQDYTFDMTYALNEVSRQYEEFASQKLPFDDIITRLDIDIDRYDRLVHTLKRLPPAQLMAYRDSTGQLVYLDRDAWRHRRDSLRQTRGELATRRSMDTTGRTRPFMLWTRPAGRAPSCWIHSVRSTGTAVSSTRRACWMPAGCRRSSWCATARITRRPPRS